ncbi:MAG: 16S rRNA (uracil(1498)-N(3))-methyltransferase, partial [Luminiphilus sp.]|nr:16S rRNA (uracil(1498)-N(3))-methyltransferase [Luminiphilus sp.]
SRVLRARVGHHIVLFDGSGHEFPAQIAGVGKHSIKALLGEATYPATESPVNTILGLCLSKGDRFDWAVQKATELGVSVIQPLESERVDFAIPEDRIEKRVAHWQQIAISACEQSGRVRVPKLSPPSTLLHWVGAVSADEKWALDGAAGLQTLPETAPKTLALLVGPEGGLTDSEISAAQQSGFRSLRLGPRVLRTETAPVVALTLVNSRWGDIKHS